MLIRIGDMVFIKDNKILLVQQIKESARGLWCLPGGRIEEGETAEEAAVREVKEEIGVDAKNVRFLDVFTLDIPNGKLEFDTFIGEFDNDLVLKEEEIMNYGWFSLDEIESGKIPVRPSCVVDKFKSALSVLQQG
jgi:8-oxo-dGTP diphosphatase